MKLLFVISLIFICFFSGLAQNDVSILNQYKYVYLSSANLRPFVRASLCDDVRDKLTECGMKVIQKKERQQMNDACAIVCCTIEEFLELGTVQGSTNTCMRLSFRDCNGKLVFLSKTGYSGVWLEGTKWGYEIATSEALQSLDNYRHEYLK